MESTSVANIRHHWYIHPASGPEALLEFPPALLLGYGVYTSFCWPLSRLDFNAHIDRLAHDAGVLGIPLAHSADSLFTMLKAHCEADSAWRLTLVPEKTSETFLGSDISNSILLLSRRTQSTDTRTPLKLKSVQATRMLSGIKHLSIAPALAQKKRARAEGYDDIVWLNSDHTLSEASTSNIFFIKENTLYTPNPDIHHCLPGITRQKIINALPELDLTLSDEAITYNRLGTFEGAFLTNAIRGTHKVESIDGIAFKWPKTAFNILNVVSDAVTS